MYRLHDAYVGHMMSTRAVYSVKRQGQRNELAVKATRWFGN